MGLDLGLMPQLLKTDTPIIELHGKYLLPLKEKV